MSYEKVKIIGVQERTNRDTGKISSFLQVEVLQTQSLYITESARYQMGLYDKYKGQECLLPAVWSTYNGKPSLSFEGDAVPIPIQSVAPAPAPSSVPSSESARSPLFGKKEAA